MSGKNDPEILLERPRFGDVRPDTRWRMHEVPQLVFSKPLIVIALMCVLGLVAAWLAVNLEPRVAFVMFLAMLGGAAILFDPFFGVLAYYMLAFLRPQEVFWGFGDARLSLVVSGFTLAAAALSFAMKPDLRFVARPQNLFIAVLWVFIFLSQHYGDFGTVQPKWMDYWNKIFLIYFIMLATTTSEKKLYILSFTVMVCISYLCIWANERYFLDGWRVVHGPGRQGATFYDENDFAMVMCMAVPFLWYFMRDSQNFFVRMGLLGLLPIAAHGIMVTFSRGGFLGLAATMFVVAIRDKNKKLGGGLILVGLIFFAVVAGDEYRNRIGSIDKYEEDESATGRIEAWETGINMMTRNPFFGVGLKRFVAAFPYYSNYTPRQAHNSWVQLGGEAGLVALFAYGMLMLLTIRSLRRVEKRLHYLPRGPNSDRAFVLMRAYEAALVGYVVCGFFLSMEDFEFFYLLVGMAQVLDRITEHRYAEAARDGTLRDPNAPETARPRPPGLAEAAPASASAVAATAPGATT